MSVHVMSQVWRYGPKDGNDLLVLLALADFADDEGYCWPSMASIAVKARMTERGARKIARRLEEAGYLSCEFGGGRGGSNRYRVHAINPERQTGNAVPPEQETGNVKPETRNTEAETRNRGSAEPSRTIKEPSEERKAREILSRVIRSDVADDFIAHRKSKRAKLTVRAAELIAADLARCSDPEGAVLKSIKQGWTGVFPDKESDNDNRNHGVSGTGTPRRAGAGTVDAFAAVAQRRAARSGRYPAGD